MSLLSTLNIGRSGLQSSSVGIEVTSHNVANASTDGFHRRSIERSLPASRRIAGGALVGQGVSIGRIRRASDELLGMRWIEANGESAKSGAASSGLSTVETYFNETNQEGVNQVLEAFFDALGRASADPSDLGHRQTLNRAGDNLGSTVSRTAENLVDAITDFESSNESATVSVNRMIADLANVNEAINRSGDAIGAGDMLDKRDNLAQQISSVTGATISYTDNGLATLYVSGHAVVSGVEYREMSTGTDANGDQTILIEASGGFLDITSHVGGEIGGTQEAAEKAADYLADLDTFAGDFATAVNAQHALGFDLNGTGGGDVFSFTVGSEARSLEFSSAIDDDPKLWAFGGTATAGVGDNTNLQALIDVESSQLFSGSTQTSGQFLGSLLSTVASDAARANTDATQLAAHNSDLEGLMKSLTSVDLDQEATSLIEFQAAYQASAKVIRAADELLQSLMAVI